MAAHVEGMRHPALGVWRSQHAAFALQKVLVLRIVSQPAEQGLAGVVAHPGVGQADRQSHEGWEVVGMELQTPGQGRDAGEGERV